MSQKHIQERNRRLEELLGNPKAQVIIVPRTMDVYEEWSDLSSEEKRSLGKDEVEYLVITGTNGDNIKTADRGGAEEARLFNFKGFERDYVTEAGPKLICRLRGQVIEPLQHLLEEKPELNSRIALYDPEVHPYPILRAVGSQQMKFSSASIPATAEEGERDVLLMQVIGDKRFKEVVSQFEEFGLLDSESVEQYSRWAVKEDERIHTLAIDYASPKLIEQLWHAYPDHVAADYLGEFQSASDAMHNFGKKVYVEPPPPVVRENKGNTKKDEPEDIYKPIPESELKAKLIEQGVTLQGVVDITGKIVSYKISFPKTNKKNDVRELVKSLTYHVTRTVSDEGLNERILLDGKTNSLYSYIPLSRESQYRSISTMKELCGTEPAIESYTYPFEKVRKRAEFRRGKMTHDTENGILHITELPVLYQYDPSPHTKEPSKRVGNLAVHVMPIQGSGQKKQLAVVVNGKITHDRQLQPILELLDLDRTTLATQYDYDEASRQTLITVGVKETKVFNGIIESFQLPLPSSATKAWFLRECRKHTPEWSQDKPEAQGFDPQRLSFVSEHGQPPHKQKRPGKPGRVHGRKSRGGGLEFTGSSAVVSGKDHSKKNATDEFAGELKEFVHEQLYPYQSRLVKGKEHDGSTANYLYLALTEGEYRTLREKIGGARMDNTNDSRLDTEIVEPQAPVKWDKDLVSVVRIKLPEALVPVYAQLPKIPTIEVSGFGEQASDRAFAGYAKQHLDLIESESKVQKSVTIDATEAFAAAMVKGKAAIGHMHFDSPNAILAAIKRIEALSAKITKYGQADGDLSKVDIEKEVAPIQGMSTSMQYEVRDIINDFTDMLDRPAELTESAKQHIEHLQQMYTMVSRYAATPDSPVDLPVILAHGVPLVKETNRAKEKDAERKTRNKQKGTFHLLKNSTDSKEGKKWLYENSIEQIGNEWEGANGFRILEAHNRITVPRSKKMDGEKGSPGGWFIVSPALANAVEARANELINTGYEEDEVNIEHILKLKDPLKPESIQDGFRTAFPNAQPGRIEYTPDPVACLKDLHATLIYEAQDHGVGGSRIEESDRGAQPVIYLAVNRASDVTTLVHELDVAGLLKGQKRYITEQDDVLIDARRRYKLNPRDVDMIDNEPAVRAALEKAKSSSIAWLEEAPKTPVAEYGTDQVQLVGADGNTPFTWEGDRRSFNDSLGEAMESKDGMRLVKVYLSPAVQGQDDFTAWRAKAAKEFSNPEAGRAKVTPKQVIESVSHARADGTHRVKASYEEQVIHGRSTNTAKRLGKLESPRDAASSIARMSTGQNGHVPEYVEGIWAAAHGVQDIALARQQALRAQ